MAEFEGQEIGRLLSMLKAVQADCSPSRSADLQELLNCDTAAIEAEISALRAEMGHLRRLSERDFALDVLNRRGLSRVLQQEVGRVERYGVESSFLFLDVDGLKAINDAFGHGEGDRLLRGLVEHLKDTLRGADQLARIGGDEFGILLPHTDQHNARRVARRLAAGIALASPSWSHHDVSVSASIGATGIDETDTVEEILSRADKAMYAEKRIRGHRFSQWKEVNLISTP